MKINAVDWRMWNTTYWLRNRAVWYVVISFLWDMQSLSLSKSETIVSYLLWNIIKYPLNQAVLKTGSRKYEAVFWWRFCKTQSKERIGQSWIWSIEFLYFLQVIICITLTSGLFVFKCFLLGRLFEETSCDVSLLSVYIVHIDITLNIFQILTIIHSRKIFL